MSTCDIEKWLLVEWGNGARGVVHSRYMLNRENQPNLSAGSTITISKRGEQQLATYIARSNERHLLEQIIGDETGPSIPPEPEVEDFVPSESSWSPSDEEESESEGELKQPEKEVVLKRNPEENRKRRILKPSNKANAVIPKSMQKSQKGNIKKYVNIRKRAHDQTKPTHENNNNKDDFKKPKNDKNYKTKCDNNNTEDVNETKFDKTMVIEKKPNLFAKMVIAFVRMFSVALAPQEYDEMDETVVLQEEGENDGVNGSTLIGEDVGEECERSHSEESNRSDDNVLITNKFGNIQTNDENKKAENEWVPIGSGKTLIHKDKYRKVKWNSYTIATRTLLLALFPRRTLATHSLTGKKSPAFQNKPAKMCLDPKKISDIIIEVIDRFHVRENLVRSIITTKCADESKMFKTRMEKKKALAPKKNEAGNGEENKENNEQVN